MEITMTSGTRQREVGSPSAKTSPKQETGKTETAVRQDTYESSLQTGFYTDALQSSLTDGLSFDGELPPTQQLQIANFEVKDSVDWNWVETRLSQSISMDNADSLIRSIDTMVSTYVATKNHLEQTYADYEDKLSENMARLDALFTQAKQRITSSYQNTVGNFYEQSGNRGVRQDMGKSLSAAIDRRVQKMDESVKERNLDLTDEGTYRIVELSLDVKSLNEQNSGIISASNLEKGEETYSLNDLQAAGIVAKAASSMNSQELNLMSDEELGLQLAVRYMKISELLKHLGLEKEMSDFLLGSFGTYLNQYSGGALSDKSRAFDSYHYALKQYESDEDIQNALEKTARKYLGNSFFDVLQTDKHGVLTTNALRYRSDLAQFSNSLASGDLTRTIQSIAGNKKDLVLAYA